MKILTAVYKDIEELAQVEMESKKHSFPNLLEAYELDIASRIERWQSYFKGLSPQTSKPPRITLKAINTQHQILGYISGHLTTRFGFDAEIQSFYILQDYQKKGIGTKLLENFVRWMRKQGANSLCVGINPKNIYKSFYLKHGGEYLNEHWIIWKNAPGQFTQ